MGSGYLNDDDGLLEEGRLRDPTHRLICRAVVPTAFERSEADHGSTQGSVVRRRASLHFFQVACTGFNGVLRDNGGQCKLLSLADISFVW